MNLDEFIENLRAKAKKVNLPEPLMQLLEADIKTKEKFRGFRRVKEDLETLLAYAICLLEFTPKDKPPQRMLCCSNVRFVNAYKAAKREDLDKALTSPWTGMKTKDKMSTMTYDLVDGKVKTVMLFPNSWYVVDAWEFTPESLPALMPLVREALKA